MKRSKNQQAVTRDKLAAKGTCRRKARESFKSLDHFGQSVSLTWNGEDQYHTILGASVSFIIIVIMSVYAGSKLYGTLLRKDPSVSKVSFIRLPEDDGLFRP